MFVKLFFDDEDFDGQLLRAISYAAYGGADIGECFETASRIEEGDRDSWYEAWTKTADRMKADAEESLKGVAHIQRPQGLHEGLQLLPRRRVLRQRRSS